MQVVSEYDGPTPDSNSDEGDAVEETNTTTRKRRKKFTRVRAACERCKTRKQKCDLVRPKCSNCIKGKAECILLDQTQQAATRPRRNSLEQRVRELEDLLGKDAAASMSGSANMNPAEGSATGSNQGPPLTMSTFTHQYLRYTNPEGEPGTLSSDPPNARPRLPRPLRVTPLPPRHIVENLVNGFFSNRWPNFPIFMHHDFSTTVLQPILNGDNVDDQKRFLLYMVLAIALIDLRTEHEEDPYDFYISAVTFYLEAVLATSNLVTVQGLMLLAIFAMSDPRGLSLWHLTGVIMRMLMDMGCHRLDKSVTTWQDELKVRVFWSGFAYDRSVAVALARPMSIPVEDISTPLPTLIDDPSSFVPSPDPPNIAAFIHTVKLRAQNGMMASVLYKPHSAPTFTDISCVKSAAELIAFRAGKKRILDDWLATAPLYAAPHTSTYQTPDWFRIAHAHSLLVLYRPTGLYPENTPENLRICSDASMGLIASYLRLYTYSKVTYTWVAMHSLFMATLTAQYVLQQSPELRKATSYQTVQINMKGCAIILAAMSSQWPQAKTCQTICETLTSQTLACFERDTQEAREAARQAMAWQAMPSTSSMRTDSTGPVIDPSNAGFTDLRSELWAWLSSVQPTEHTTIDPSALLPAQATIAPNAGFVQQHNPEWMPTLEPVPDHNLTAAELDALLYFQSDNLDFLDTI